MTINPLILYKIFYNSILRLLKSILVIIYFIFLSTYSYLVASSMLEPLHGTVVDIIFKIYVAG